MTEANLQPCASSLVSSPLARCGLMAFGWICVAIGLVAVVVPGLPTTVFMLMAAWAFSKSSERFGRWIVDHPRIGPTVAAWRESGAVPLKAKILAVSMMGGSFVWIVIFVAHGWVMPAVVGAVMAGSSVYLVSRPTA